MKNWLFSGDFRAQIENREAMRDANEKMEYVTLLGIC